MEWGTFTKSADNKDEGGEKKDSKKSFIHKSLKEGKSVQEIMDQKQSNIDHVSRYAKGRACTEAEVLYIHGETGAGKTTTSSNMNPSLQRAGNINGWDGYKGEEIAILNEFQSCFPCGAFLRLTDPYPPHFEIKGDFTHNKVVIYHHFKHQRTNTQK